MTSWARSVLSSSVLMPLALSAVAALLVVLDAPSTVRTIVVVPVLILVPGWASTVLLVGRGRDREQRVLRLCLCPLLGLLLLMGGALVLDAVGVGLARNTVVGCACAVTVVVVVAAARSARIHGAARESGRRYGPRALALGVAAGVVLIAAVGGAKAMQPVTSAGYVNLVLTGPATAAAGQVHASAGTEVQFRWKRYSFGSTLPGRLPTVAAAVGGAATAEGRAVTQAAEPDTDTDAVDVQSGTYTVLAPTQFGTYRVVLSVTDEPTPMFSCDQCALVIYLEVGR